VTGRIFALCTFLHVRRVRRLEGIRGSVRARCGSILRKKPERRTRNEGDGNLPRPYHPQLALWFVRGSPSVGPTITRCNCGAEMIVLDAGRLAGSGVGRCPETPRRPGAQMRPETPQSNRPARSNSLSHRYRMTRYPSHGGDKLSRLAPPSELSESYSPFEIRSLAEGRRPAPILPQCLASPRIFIPTSIQLLT